MEISSVGTLVIGLIGIFMTIIGMLLKVQKTISKMETSVEKIDITLQQNYKEHIVFHDKLNNNDKRITLLEEKEKTKNG